jgi:cysteine-rich repeat protein
LKLDASGNVQFQKTYGGAGIDRALSAAQTSDGGYTFAGQTNSVGAGSFDAWVARLDSSGNVVYSKTYGGAGSDLAASVLQTSDGGYAAAGQTASFGAGGTDAWLLKLDATGNVMFEKTYGGASAEAANALATSADGGYALGGQTGTFGTGTDEWLVKVDANGNIPACGVVGTSTATVQAFAPTVTVSTASPVTSAATISASAGVATTTTMSTAAQCFAAVAPACGDGVVGGVEQCDDGNTLSGDGCSATCQNEAGACGNNVQEGAEACDGADLGGHTCLTRGFNGGTLACSAGCSAFVTTGCTFAPVCGNGVLETVENGEQCDDGGVAGGDGCDNICKIEACGNGVVQAGEQCDDGNTAGGDGCDSVCFTEACGNRVVQAGEQCDDGNANNGDGCSATCQVEAGATLTTFIRSYGGTLAESSGSIVQTSDGGFAFAGVTQSFGAGFNDAWLVKLDQVGNVQFEKTYGGSSHDFINAMVKTSDGGFALAGSTQSFGAGLADAWLLKLDSSGNAQFQKSYGASGADGVNDVVQTSDGGYAIIGFSEGNVSFLKLDSSGNIQLQRSFGGNFEEAKAIIQTSDGGYAVVGRISQNNDVQAWLLKLDASGNIQFQRAYGGTGFDTANSLVQTSDGGYAVIAETFSFGAGSVDIWMLKLDASGNIQFQRTYGDAGGETGNSIVQTSDGGFAIASAGFGEVLLLKLDGSGNIQFQKAYGGLGNDFGNAVIQTSDGGYAIVGDTFSFGAGSQDVWVIRVDGNGNVDACGLVSNTVFSTQATTAVPLVANATSGAISFTATTTTAASAASVATVSEQCSFVTVGPGPDGDADGIPNAADNCPTTANPDQLNSDGQGGGDLCDVCPVDSTDTCDQSKVGKALIGSAGGSFSNADGSASLTIPAGALASSRSMSINPTRMPVNVKIATDEGGANTIATFVFAPNGQTFATPVTMILRANVGNIGPGVISAFRIFVFNAATGQFDRLATAASEVVGDSVGNEDGACEAMEVCAFTTSQVTHFTPFAAGPLRVPTNARNTLSPGNAVGLPNETVLLPLVYNNTNDIAGVQFEMRFDPTLIFKNLTGTALRANSSVVIFNLDQAAGIVRLAVLVPGLVTVMSGGVLNAEFLIPASAMPGTIFPVSVEAILTGNISAREIGNTSIGGSILVLGVTDIEAPTLVNDPFVTPRNVSSLVLSGTFTDTSGTQFPPSGIASIEVLVNNASQGFASLNPGFGAVNGTWNISISLTQEGENAIAEIAKDVAGNTAQFNKTIFLDTQAPVIVNDPVPQFTNATSINITGTVTDPDPSSGLANFTINGLLATLFRIT